MKEDKKIKNDDVNREYSASIDKISNFIDSFSDFMYHSIGVAIENAPQDHKHDEAVALLMSLRKEVSDFQTKVESIKEKFKV